MVLFRIEDFQQRRRRIAPVVLSDLVDLVDHDQRVVHPDLRVALDEFSRHGADVGLAMTANFRLVGHAPHRHPHELSPESLSDGRAERSLADARWADEAENRSFQIALQLHHREKFDDAFLDLFQRVMPLIENLLRLFQVQPILGLLLPGDLQDRVEMTSQHRVVRR